MWVIWVAQFYPKSPYQWKREAETQRNRCRSGNRGDEIVGVAGEDASSREGGQHLGLEECKAVDSPSAPLEVNTLTLIQGGSFWSLAYRVVRINLCCQKSLHLRKFETTEIVTKAPLTSCCEVIEVAVSSRSVQGGTGEGEPQRTPQKDNETMCEYVSLCIFAFLSPCLEMTTRKHQKPNWRKPQQAWKQAKKQTKPKDSCHVRLLLPAPSRWAAFTCTHVPSHSMTPSGCPKH